VLTNATLGLAFIAVMPPTIEPWTELAVAGAGWEVRCTEAVLASEALPDRCDAVPEALAEALVTIDRERPIEEQLAQIDDGRLLLEGPPNSLLIEFDGRTHWVIALHGQAEHRPTSGDRWRRDRSSIARWIGELRVVGPLLSKQAAETGTPCRCELSEGGWLGVQQSREDVRVFVAPPDTCSIGESAVLRQSPPYAWRRNPVGGRRARKTASITCCWRKTTMTPELTPLSTDFLAKNVARLRDALDHHNATCAEAPTAFLLHPYDIGVLPFDDLWGVPLVADRARPVKTFHIACPAAPEGDEGELPTE
jgi:hypothetical protein